MEQGWSESSFIQLRHGLSAFGSLAQNFRAVVLQNMNEMAAIFQFSPTGLSDQKVFNLVTMQTENDWAQSLSRGGLGARER